MTSLFGQAAPSGTVNSGAGNAGTNGLHITATGSATLNGVWHYSSASDTQLPTTIALWTTQASPSTGTLVTSNAATWLTGPGGSAAAAGSGWCYAAFTTAQALTSGTDYMVGQFRNDATNRWFSYYSVTWPVTNGVITAPADTGGVSANSQGWYVINASLTFPSGHSGTGGDNFGMDVEFTSGGAHTDTAAVTVTPVVSAPRIHAATDTAAVTVIPAVSAPRVHAATTRAALTVTPAFAAAATAANAALTISIAAKAGLDPVNSSPYSSGVNLYGANGQQIGMALTGNALALLMTPPSMTKLTYLPRLFTLGDNPGAANETSLLVLTSGKENNLNDAAVQLWSETADGTGAAVIVFEFGGTVAARLTAAGLSSDTWHAATLINSWNPSGGGVNGARYRLLPLGAGFVEIEADITNATATGNSVAFTLPAGYRPASGRNYPASWNNPQASNAASAPWVNIDTSGNVQVTGLQVAGKGIFFHELVPLD